MKKLLVLLIAAGIAASCQKSEIVSDFTGNETTYALQQGSDYNISGTITFKEKKDGSINSVIQLKGTDGDAKYPVHLHLGSISSPGADVALLLTPVAGATGKSETSFSRLADESSINYNQLIGLNACIKIHLGDVGPSRDVILAAGNIGSALTSSDPNGRTTGVAVCKSE